MHDLGLYIHVPFCPTKCGYCDFYSVVPKGERQIHDFVTALICELNQQLARQPRPIVTIFVGGGTPTALPPDELDRLFSAIGRLARDHQVGEFTVEANPGSLTAAKAAILRQHHVNRISVGAQSFHPAELSVLERIHQPPEIIAAARIIHAHGFEHFNLDLIFGVPGQTQASWSASIEAALQLQPDHLACYGLTYEPGTPLYEQMRAGQVRAVPDDFEAELFDWTRRRLADAGLRQYEISNYARPGAVCRHNLRYWHNEPTVGVGPSAAGYLDGVRRRNVPDVAEYTRRVLTSESPVCEEEELAPAERAGETAMLMLRLIAGIDIEQFRQTTGFDPFQLFAEPIDRHTRGGRLTVHAGRIALTDAGRLLGDTVMADFLKPTTASPRPARSS